MLSDYKKQQVLAKLKNLDEIHKKELLEAINNVRFTQKTQFSVFCTHFKLIGTSHCLHSLSENRTVYSWDRKIAKSNVKRTESKDNPTPFLLQKNQ